MSVRIATTRVACNTAPGNQDITIADLGSLTPIAARFIVIRATSDGTAADHAVVGYGAATSTTKRWAMAVSSQHNQDTSVTYRRQETDECVLILDPTDGSVDGEADFVSFIANGVRINWGDAPAGAYLLVVDLFAGTDLSAQADTFILGNQDVEVNVNTVGFEPDILLPCTVGTATVGSAENHAVLSAGVVRNGASVEQHCFGWLSLDAQASSDVSGRVTSTYGVMQTSTAVPGNLLWGGDFGSFDADGFSCWARVANSGDRIGFLALAFGNAVDTWVGMKDAPNATGNWQVADPAFRPQWGTMGLTMMEALDTGYTDGNAGSIGFSSFDADDEYCGSIQDEDGQPTTDTQCLSDNQAVNFPQDDGSAGYAATFVSFDANGWTLNFTAVIAEADKWWCLAIEASVVVPRHPAAYFDGPTVF